MCLLIIFALLGASVVSADTFLIKSVDGGRSWTDIDPGAPHQFLYWLRVDPRLSNLYALTPRPLGGQLLVSTDRGQTWEARQNFQVLPAGPWISRAAASAGTIYLAYEDPASIPQKSIMMARITNAGTDVLHYPAQGLTFGEGWWTLLDLAAPAEPTSLYALIGNPLDQGGPYLFQGLWRSENGGRSWSRLEPAVNANCVDPQLRVDPSGSRTYLLCGSDFFKSTDRGDSWTQTRVPDGISTLEIGPGAPGTVYGIRADEIWKSTDAGETWQRAGSLPGVWRLQVHPTNPSVMFAAGTRGIHKSEDGGNTWTTLLATQLEYPGLLGIQVDPRAPDTLYGIGENFQRVELRLHERQTFLRNLLGERQVAPGSLVSIYGRDLASETRVAEVTPLPRSLGGASVLFHGQPAPLLFASPDQINAQVPFGLTGAVAVEVRRADATVDRQTINLSPTGRGAFILRERPSRQAAPLLFHGSDSRRVTADDPARRGEAITLFAVGMGELQPFIASGELPPTPPPQLRDPPCVTFSEQPGRSPLASASPLWAGAAPGLIGVYQVNVEIPASLSAASYALSLTIRPLPRPGSPFPGDCSVAFQGAPLDSITLEVR